MANANIDALYVGSLKNKKYYISFSRNFTFYKWCVTKVAHCKMIVVEKYEYRILVAVLQRISK